jgi:hypothetical protein
MQQRYRGEHMANLKATSASAPSWAAIATVDLAKVGANAFAEQMEKLDEAGKKMRKEGNLPDIPLKTGKMRFTPEDAEKALLHNGGNRRVRLSHVQGIAAQMQKGLWRLAQPIMFDEDGDLLDGQHRLLAIYFGNLIAELMVMIVPRQDDLFAVLDNGNSRSSADTLQTSGINGVSAAAAGAAKFLYRYEHNQMGVFKQPKVLKMSNFEVLNYVRAHPEIVEAAREVTDDYPTAVTAIGDRGVAAAFGYLVNQRYEDGVLHDFFTALGLGAEGEWDDPIAGLHKRLTEVTKEKLANPHKLALLIKAFQMDVASEKIGKKGLHIRDNEGFPRIEDAGKAEAA